MRINFKYSMILWYSISICTFLLKYLEVFVASMVYIKFEKYDVLIIFILFSYLILAAIFVIYAGQ